MDEFFLDINGNEVYEGDSVELIDNGNVFAKGKVVEIDLEYDGVAIWCYAYGNYEEGNGIFIDLYDVIPKHFRKINLEEMQTTKGYERK